MVFGISLYLQGTPTAIAKEYFGWRYIPVPTGNSFRWKNKALLRAVYPCTYRELCSCRSIDSFSNGISLYLQGTRTLVMIAVQLLRYIPVPTGNSSAPTSSSSSSSVYPCTYRELPVRVFSNSEANGISLYLQGTL